MMKSIKHIILALLLCLLGEATALAVTVYPKPRRVVQPDGSVLTVVGRGDEFCHFVTTTDGYTVVKGEDGYYRYAELYDGVLVAGPVKACDASMRGKAETDYLATKERYIAPAMTAVEGSLKASPMIRGERGVAKGERSIRKASAQQRNYRGLVILVNYKDQKFTRGNIAARKFYNNMINQEGFSSYTDPYYGKQVYTGSVRDYFIDNSNGNFRPDFDVIGPVDIDVTQFYMHTTKRTYDVMERVLKKVDGQVDFTRYDSDGDGVVDMVYVLYAGFSSSYAGNDERLLWPHAGSMKDEASTAKNLTLDGMQFGRFACSTELYGWAEDGEAILDGIGVIVHEFSHVLGFMDHYDTSGGYQEHPNTWDVMSAGNYSEDFNRTPVAYNSYEKHTAGFISPTDITDKAGSTIKLQSIEQSDDACLLRSYQDKVVYYMENRQNTKWDKYLIGHGLLVWRVDSTNMDYWRANALNVSTRACFRLVRACGTQGSFLTGVVDTDYDSFPGTHNITELDNDDDDANLLSYDGYPCPVMLRNITEKNGIITFGVEKDDYARNQPITYQLPSKLTATAERFDGTNWVPVKWAVRTGKDGDNNVIYNVIPNAVGVTSTSKDYSKGVYVSYIYSNDVSHTIVINAQRVALNNDYGTWFCDINDVNSNQGAGAMTLSVDRYGIPTFKDPASQLSFCTLKPKAYLVSQKNLIDQLDVYRNVTFSDYDGTDDPSGINEISTSHNINSCHKIIDHGRIIIVKNGRKYTTAGQAVGD